MDVSRPLQADAIEARRAVMKICAAATAAELGGIVAQHLAAGEQVTDLRPPERGLVMLRGRIGGEGAPFNLGEATVTRAAIRLADGTEGFAYHLGRDMTKARHAAVLDALAQQEARHSAVWDGLLPIAQRLHADAVSQAGKTAATRVNFFTMTRGDD